MDSKQSFPVPYDGEAAPPSYTDAVSPSTTKHKSNSSTSQYYSQQIQSQLQSITTQITSLQTQKTLLSQAKDEKVLSLLIIHIQTYLSEFAKSGLLKGTLIMVPKKALEDETALPVDYDFKDLSEYDRVVRVCDRGDGDGDGDGEMWYWRDEDMAGRLAGYLAPVPDPRMAELPPRKEEVVTAAEVQGGSSQSSSKGFWGRKKSTTKTIERPVLVEERDSKVENDTKMAVVGAEEKVLMVVKAEEVVFRTENDFGMFGTESGWAVVLKLKVVRGRR